MVDGATNAYINNCPEGKRNETEMVGMTRKDFRTRAFKIVTTIENRVDFKLPFESFESMVDYVADNLEYVYLTGRKDGQTSVKNFINEVF